MSSSSGTCEIVELKEDHNFIKHSKGIHQSRAHEKGSKPPALKQGSRSLEDDINKLFEAINIRNSSSGPSRKNALKKPMRASVSSASGIGFSEPVSLKQALRGLCISQASEMAAMKRLSKPPGSPALSDSGKLTSLYRSVVFESGKEGRAEISLVPEESTSSSANSANHSVHSSPRFVFETTSSRMGSTPRQNEIVPSSKEVGSQLSKVDPGKKEKNNLGPSLHFHSTSNNVLEPDKNIPPAPAPAPAQLKLANNRGKSISAPIKLANKAAPKLRRKGRLLHVPSSSCQVSSNKVTKSTRNSPPAFKPVLRNKNVVKKKTKKDLTSIPGISDTYNEISGNLGPATSQLICQRCQCTLKKESSKNSPTLAPPPSSTSNEISYSNGKNGINKEGPTSNGYDRSNHVVANANTVSKSRDKGEFSQSSKSSGVEYSSSTSISEDSTLSGSSFGSRPHMSKDLRWEAIQNIMKRHGFLGLGHFNLLKKLGCGDIGTVYLAELNGTNCLFAIKVMDIEFLGRRNKMPRAQTEREILRILDHPFLPTLYAQFVSDNLSCLVMEFCPGGDLHVLRQKQPERYFSEQAARFYVAEVLLALEYLHMLGIVYRDLKPENILVREDGHIMLTDFDLSLRCSVNPTLLKSTSSNLDPPRMSGPCAGSNCIDPFCIKPTCQVSCFSPRLLPAAAKTRKLKLKADAAAAHMRSLPQLVAEPTDARSNSFVGTHEYLAPEIIKGEGHGSAVDWWTFGVFLYELLYGKTPFKGAGNEETLVNVVLESLKFPDYPIVSFHARDLIRGLLVKEPENRLGSERGAAEIKQHPFFDGLNWALIRCETPPEIPDLYDIGIAKMADQEKGRKYLDCGDTGEQLEFELF